MQKENNVTAKSIVLGIVALIALLSITLSFAYAVYAALRSLESELATAIIAASATVLASVLAIVVSKRYEQKAKLTQEVRDQKIPVYEDLISVFFRTVFAEKVGRERPSEQEIMQAFADMTPKLIIWGSEDVIRAWNAIRYHNWSDSSSQDSLILWNDFLVAVRKDIGNGVNNLNRFELLKLFINDLQEDETLKSKNNS